MDNWTEQEVRALLPDSEKGAFDDIVSQRVLGASRHIAMIGNMIEAMAMEGRKEQIDTKTMTDGIRKVAQYFIDTRGEASQAVSNAILIMTHNLNAYETLPSSEAADEIIKGKRAYGDIASQAAGQAVDYAVEAAREMEHLFLYDYSSTVEKFLQGLGKNGKSYTVSIAESRVIDGGVPFIKACQDAGHKIHFMPDASIMYYMRQCDGAFMGAETFYPDGTGFNTVGSDLVGLVCRHYGIPLYFLTPLIKLDVRPVYGKKKNLVFDDMREKLTKNWPPEVSREGIDFMTPELVGVGPEFIRAFITEKGIIPSGQIYGISMEYSRQLRGGSV